MSIPLSTQELTSHQKASSTSQPRHKTAFPGHDNEPSPMIISTVTPAERPFSLEHAMLQVRALGFASTSNITCAAPQPGLVGEPITGSLTFHHLMILISAACLGITILSTVYASWTHLHRYTVPQEQRQILRIINLPTAYAIFNFLALLFYNDYYYIAPIAGVYEAFTVAALFLLMLEFVCPDGTDREKFFDALPAVDKKGNPVGGGSLLWFKRTWAQVFQYPLTKLVFVVIQIVTQYYHVYCENSFSPKYAHLWLTIADFLFVGGALGAVIKFAQRMGKAKAFQANQRVRQKIWAYIGILVFQMLQGIIFGLLNGKLFSPNKTVTYNDINFGIPAFLTCLETAIFSFIFMWAYSSKEYAEGHRMDRLGQALATRTKTLKAIVDALNLSDVVAGTVIAIGSLVMRVQSRYGGSSTPQREKLMQDGVGMEPLSNRNRMRGYSGGSEFDDQYTPPLETQYDGRTTYAPTMPQSARDPSPPNRARTFRADGLRPQEYQPLTRSRDPSPIGGAEQLPRNMV